MKEITDIQSKLNQDSMPVPSVHSTLNMFSGSRTISTPLAPVATTGANASVSGSISKEHGISKVSHQPINTLAVSTLKFEIQKLPNERGLKLLFTHSFKESSATFEQIFQLNALKEWDIKSIKASAASASSFYSITLSPDAQTVHFSLLGTDGQIAMDKEGNLTVGPFNSSFRIALQTEGSIKVDSIVQVFALHFQAKDITIFQPIETNEKLRLDIKGTLSNLSILHAKKSIIIRVDASHGKLPRGHMLQVLRSFFCSTLLDKISIKLYHYNDTVLYSGRCLYTC